MHPLPYSRQNAQTKWMTYSEMSHYIFVKTEHPQCTP